MKYFFSLIAFCGVLFGFEKEFDICKDGITLHCRVMGEGKPLIVINGGPGISHDHLLPHMSKLAEENLVIFYDQRGCGLSDCEINEESLSIENLIKDIDLIRDVLQLGKVNILGHSWGGFLAMNYAIANPQNIDKLVLSNPAPASIEGVGIYFKSLEKSIEPYKEQLTQLAEYNFNHELNEKMITDSLKFFFQIFFHDKEHWGSLDFHFTEESAKRYYLANDILSEIFQKTPFDLRPALKKLDIETLIVHGASDVIPLEIMERIQSSIKGSELFVQAECGHFPMIEKSAEYSAKVNDFLRN